MTFSTDSVVINGEADNHDPVLISEEFVYLRPLFLSTHRIEQLHEEFHAGNTRKGAVARTVISGPRGSEIVFECMHLLMCVCGHERVRSFTQQKRLSHHRSHSERLSHRSQCLLTV